MHSRIPSLLYLRLCLSVCLNTTLPATVLNSLNWIFFNIRVCWEVLSCNLVDTNILEETSASFFRTEETYQISPSFYIYIYIYIYIVNYMA